MTSCSGRGGGGFGPAGGGRPMRRSLPPRAAVAGHRAGGPCLRAAHAQQRRRRRVRRHQAAGRLLQRSGCAVIFIATPGRSHARLAVECLHQCRPSVCILRRLIVVIWSCRHAVDPAPASERHVGVPDVVGFVPVQLAIGAPLHHQDRFLRSKPQCDVPPPMSATLASRAQPAWR